MADVSIIIVSWNARQFLLDCLQSIRDTAGRLSVEVIVVDNDSSDGSAEAVQERFPSTILIRNPENLGFAKANNVGIARSSGRYLALVNSDVVVLENCVQEMVGFMDAHEEVGMAGPRVLNADRTLQPSARRFPSLGAAFARALFLDRLLPQSLFHLRSHMSASELERMRNVDVLVGCFWMVRRKALEEVGRLDEDFFMYGEDNDWCRRFHKANWGVTYYPGGQVIHFGGASSSNAPTRFFLEMKKAELRYWEKHHGRAARWIAAGILFLHCCLRVAGWKLKCVLRPAARDKSLPMLERYVRCIQWLTKGAGAWRP